MYVYRRQREESTGPFPVCFVASAPEKKRLSKGDTFRKGEGFNDGQEGMHARKRRRREQMTRREER